MKDCEIWPQQSKGKKAAITSVTAQVQNPGGRMVVKQFIAEIQFYILDSLKLERERDRVQGYFYI